MTLRTKLTAPFADCLLPFKSSLMLGCSPGAGQQPHLLSDLPVAAGTVQSGFTEGLDAFQLPLEGNGICTCPLGMWLSPCLRRVMFATYLASLSDIPSICTHVVSLSVILSRGSVWMYVSCPFLSYFIFLIILIFTLFSIDFEVFLSKWAAFSYTFPLTAQIPNH